MGLTKPLAVSLYWTGSSSTLSDSGTPVITFTSRNLNLLMASACVFLVAAALFMEHGLGLEPCPMCIVQRFMVITTGLFALIAAVHNPGILGIRLYGLLTGLSAMAGGYVAGRHVWLQNLPEEQVPACGPSLEYMLDVLPLSEVLYSLFLGDGNCANLVWTFLGISIPGWTFLAFLGLLVTSLYQLARPNRPD